MTTASYFKSCPLLSKQLNFSLSRMGTKMQIRKKSFLKRRGQYIFFLPSTRWLLEILQYIFFNFNAQSRLFCDCNLRCMLGTCFQVQQECTPGQIWRNNLQFLTETDRWDHFGIKNSSNQIRRKTKMEDYHKKIISMTSEFAKLMDTGNRHASSLT